MLRDGRYGWPEILWHRAIQAMRDRGESRSDWQAAERLSETDAERLAEEDDGPLPPGWETTIDVGVPEPATPVHIRLDSKVLRWFKAKGPGYQTRINAVLRAFVKARQRTDATDPSNREPRKPPALARSARSVHSLEWRERTMANPGSPA